MIHLNNIVIVGVGGTGLSSIAGILHDLGYQNIVGINDSENQITQTLSDRGIEIIIGHGKYQVSSSDFVIYADVQSIYDGPEVQQSLRYQEEETKHYHMPMTYNQFLAELSKHFRTMAITGTNGKSSTAALAITAGAAGSGDFALGIVGSMLPDHEQRNYVIGQGHEAYLHEVMEHILRGSLMRSPIKQSVFVLEACEYREHFLMYDVDTTITTNITHDHHDYFPTKESYHAAFFSLWKLSGNVVISEEDRDLVALASSCVSDHSLVLSSFVDFPFDHVVGSFWSYNASLSLQAWDLMDSGFDIIAANRALQDFSGLWRRMEYLGSTKSDTGIYSDYGHHPDAFLRLIPEMKEQFPDKRLIVLFEPHQARRLLSLWDEFVVSVAGSDDIIIYRPYTARERRDDLGVLLEKRTGSAVPDPDILGDAFAKAVCGVYVRGTELLLEEMTKWTDDDIVLIASAGVVDGVMRDVL